MANKSFKPCLHAGCEKITREKYCDAHKPKATHGISMAWRFLYNTKAWKALRQRALLRHPWCVDCAKQNLRVASTEVDHIVPHKGNKVLFYDFENLQGLCHRCHSKKTMKELRNDQSDL